MTDKFTTVDDLITERFDVPGKPLARDGSHVESFLCCSTLPVVTGNAQQKVDQLRDVLHSALLERHQRFGEAPRSVRRCTRTPDSRAAYNELTVMINALTHALESAEVELSHAT